MVEERPRARTSQGQHEPTLQGARGNDSKRSVPADPSRRMQASERAYKKEITLIGEASQNLKVLIKKMDNQYLMAKRGGQQQENNIVDLAFMNKYVGYVYQHTQVELLVTTSKLPMLVINGSDKKSNMKFPRVKLLIDRVQGTLQISEGGSFGTNSLAFGKNDLMSVKLLNVGRGQQMFGSEELKMSNAKLERYKRNSMQLEATQHAEFMQFATGSEKQHIDKSFPFSVKTVRQDITFMPNSRQERDILMHEINNICRDQNVDVMMLSARGDVMQLINPVESFNAWNLSIVCGPTPSGQSAFTRSGTKSKSSSVHEQAQIIKAEAEFVSYIRDGVRCYVSQHLRKEMYITDGTLWKESKAKFEFMSRKYRQQFCVIDFKNGIIKFKKHRQSDNFEAGKDIPFSDLLEVESVQIDVFKGEHKKTIDLEFRQKFVVRTLQREFMFFSRNEIEREVWMESFAKAIDINKQGVSSINLKAVSNDYYQMVSGNTPSQYTVPRHKKITIKSKIDGAEVYKSDQLQVNKTMIAGTVMKAIDNISLFHSEKYHERYFMLEYGQPYCYFYESKTEETFHRTHRQTELISCSVIEDSEIDRRIQQKEGKRSRSLLRRVMQDQLKRCKWNFPFSIEFKGKSYELYAPTRTDRDKWIHILSTIAEMNRQGVKLVSMTPFEYNADQERIKNKLLEEEQMTESARERKENVEMEKQIFEQVHLWLKLNQETMKNHVPQIEEFKTDNIVVQVDGVRGHSLLVTRSHASIAGAQDIGNSDHGQLRLTRIELFINFRIQTLLVQKLGVSGVSKYTFSEITVAEFCDYVIADSDCERNKVEKGFTFCFRIQVKNNPPKVIACASQEERYQWVRCLSLIIQMRNLGIDPGLINIFTFEQFRQYQLKLAAQQFGIDDGSEPIDVPVNAAKLPKQQSANGVAADEADTENEGEGLQTSPQQVLDQANNRSMASSMQRVAFRARSSIDSTMEKMQHFETHTFALDYRYIEGYLVKEIENLNVLSITKRHLRYFRIIFSTGKLNVKVDKSTKEMRSFELKDLLSVKALKVQESKMRIEGGFGEKMMEQSQVQDVYKFNQTGSECIWEFKFQLTFVQRNFVLSVLTRREYDEWLRIFQIVSKMNKVGIPIQSKNPYLFEDQHLGLTQNNSMMDIPTHLNDTINKNRLGNSTSQVEFGLGSMMIQNHLDPDIDNVQTNTLKDNNSLVFKSNTASMDGLEKRFTDTIQGGMKGLRSGNTAAAAAITGQDRQSRFSGGGPVRAVPHQHATQGTVVNQNITVQNITIQQMNMMQNGDGKNSQGATSQVPPAQEPSGNADQLAAGKNPAMMQGGQPRAASVEVVADLNTTMADKEYRSAGGDRRKKKKKKKKPGHSADPYATIQQKNLAQKAFEMDNSTIGGVSEVDDAVYRTDVVQKFVEEDQDDEVMQIVSKNQRDRPSSSSKPAQFDYSGASGSRSVAVRLENNFASIDDDDGFGPVERQDGVTLLQPNGLSARSKDQQQLLSKRSEIDAGYSDEPSLGGGNAWGDSAGAQNYNGSSAHRPTGYGGANGHHQEQPAKLSNSGWTLDEGNGVGNDDDQEQLVDIDNVIEISHNNLEDTQQRRQKKKQIVHNFYDNNKDNYSTVQLPRETTQVEEYSETPWSSNIQQLESKRSERESQPESQIDLMSSPNGKDDAMVARRSKKRRLGDDGGRDESRTKISLHKIRLAGSQERLQSLQQVQRSIDNSAASAQIDLKNQAYYQSTNAAVSKKPSAVNMETIKQIASGNTEMGNGAGVDSHLDTIEVSRDGFNSVTQPGMAPAFSIPTISRKKKVVKIKKRKDKKEGETDSMIELSPDMISAQRIGEGNHPREAANFESGQVEEGKVFSYATHNQRRNNQFVQSSSSTQQAAVAQHHNKRSDRGDIQQLDDVEDCLSDW